MTFGIPGDVIITDSERGAFEVVPYQYSVTYNSDSWPIVEITGHMGDAYKAETSKQEQLRKFTVLDLMDEVGRRIKSGENKRDGKH